MRLVLSIYRRHREKCKFADDRISKKCRCALWATGTLEGEPYRKSLKTRSFERAEQLKRDIENGNKPKEQSKSITIKDALAAFIKDCESRNLNPSTLGKYKRLESAIRDFAERNSSCLVCEWTGQLSHAFRSSWKLSPRTASKQLERLRAFFRFCIENDWISKNPAKAIKAPQVKPNPTLPYSDIELQKIFQNGDFRTATFYKLLLHSGLRILDASTLRPERIQEGKLLLYQAKTGQPVWVPLPPDLIHDLAKLPLIGGFYFAVESEKPESIAEYYRKDLMKIAVKTGMTPKKIKGVKRKNAFHAHRFRDTFAVNLLKAGVPLEEVSMLLGHSSIKITEQHYSPWVKARQDRLEEMVRKTWTKKLMLVKK